MPEMPENGAEVVSGLCFFQPAALFGPPNSAVRQHPNRCRPSSVGPMGPSTTPWPESQPVSPESLGDSLLFAAGRVLYRRRNVLYSFDMEYRSLTVNYPCSDAAYNACCPFWQFLPDDKEMNYQQEGNHIRDEARSLTCSYEKFVFDHPKFFSPLTSRTGSIVQRSKLWPRWHPRTPSLMFTHHDDRKYKVLDPCTKVVYELLIPELSGSKILASNDGWLFALGRFSNFFFINPFSKKRVNLPYSDRCLFGVAFSAPPTNPECRVFCISEVFGEPTVRISIHHRGDEWTTREFENNITFKLAYI